MLVGINGFWDDWELRAKVTFDGPNRLIIINPGVTDLDFRTDIYTEWKQWVRVYDHMKYAHAITVVGGDPITPTVSLGATFFLANGWKIRTWEGDHRLTLAGNVYSDDGSNQFVSTIGNWNITINLKVSNLIDQVSTTGSGANPSEVADAVWAHPSAVALQDGVKETLGLVGKNQVVDQVVADPSGGLSTARLRTYPTEADSIAGTNVLGTYHLVLSKTSGVLSLVRMSAQ